jgi:hypothetical protein
MNLHHEAAIAEWEQYYQDQAERGHNPEDAMSAIPTTQREQFESLILDYANEYGPWSVLHLFTETMREPFRQLASDEAAARPKRTRKAADKAGPMRAVRDAHIEVMQLNSAMPVGTDVTYYPGPREHGGRACQIRGPFDIAEDGTIVVWVTGQPGYVAANHVERA